LLGGAIVSCSLLDRFEKDLMRASENYIVFWNSDDISSRLLSFLE
jgi:hypothetical protein